MKTFRLLAAAAVLTLAWTSSDLRAQCTESLLFSANLMANESYTDSLLLVGDLSSVTVNLDVVTAGGSYPSDLMMYIFAPNGDCIVWGGWNVDPEPGCTDLSTLQVGMASEGTPPSGSTMLRLTSRLMD